MTDGPSASLYGAVRAATKASTAEHRVTGRFVGKVVDAYDGDTCRVAIAFPALDGGEAPAGRAGAAAAGAEPVVEFLKVRMLGYDAPEMRKGGGLDPVPYGREVKAVLHALVLGRMVVLDIPEPDKADPYGRVLARMYAVARGAAIRVPYFAPPPPGCWAGLRRACCCRGGAGGAPAAASIAATDGATSAPGVVAVTVRRRAVYVPVTVDVPEGYALDDEGLEALLDVNQWMVDNAGVKTYDGATARPAWTADELEFGYGLR